MCGGEGDESGEVHASQPVQRCECLLQRSAPSESGELWKICEQWGGSCLELYLRRLQLAARAETTFSGSS